MAIDQLGGTKLRTRAIIIKMLIISIICLLVLGSLLSVYPKTFESEDEERLNKTSSNELAEESLKDTDSGIKVRKLPTVSDLPIFGLPSAGTDNLATGPSQIVEHQSSSDTTASRGSRATMNEDEPNNEFTIADIIASTPMTIENALLNTNSDPIDHFQITLDGEDKSVDNLTVEVTNLDSSNYYDYFYLSIFGAFEKKYLHMKTESIRVRDWYNAGDIPSAIIHAYASGHYYIKASVFNQYGYNSNVNYELRVTKEQIMISDDNQVPDFADEINGPVSKGKVDMARDMFDWFYIDAADPENYRTNFSINVDITGSLSQNSMNQNGLMLYFVTELHLLIYQKDYKGDYSGEEIIGNMYHKFDQPDPLIFFEHYNTVSSGKDLQFYVGLYVQTFGRLENGDGEYVAGDGYCDGWIEYSITKIQAKPMIRPILANASVESPVGKVYHTFTYTVAYFDENNDRPQMISIEIDNRIGPNPMIKVDKSDKDYRDGVMYQYVIDGSEFLDDREEHEYRIRAEDIELPAFKLEGIGPIITDNILPAARPSGSNVYTLYEDDPISYLDLNTTFEDADNDTLYFQLSNNNKDWSSIYESDNITIKVITLDDMRYLEFKPKDNMFNRYHGDTFGGEIVYINVSDDPGTPDNGDWKGNVSRAHYLLNPFELEIIIKGVNDPPEIKTSFSLYFLNGEMEIVEDTGYFGFDLSEIFWDPVEDDQLTFSVRNNKNIEVTFYSNGTADIIPNENWTGTESIEIIASDGMASVYDTLKIKIAPVNDNPFLNYTPKQVIYEDEWFNYTFIGYDSADSEEVFFETNLMEKLELTEEEFSFNALTGELSFKPNNNNVGTYKDITVTVRDFNGGSTTQKIVFEIINTPDPPEPEILRPSHGDRFLITERIDFQGESFDPDDRIQIETHTYRWHSNINGNLSTNPTFKTELSEGEHRITFEVSDSLFSRSQSILIMVLSVSDTDTDGDDIPDYWELLHSLNQFDPQDAENDPDGDTYSNFEEYLGMDLKPGGNDDTNPRDPSEHPEKHYEPPSEEEDLYLFEIMIIALIIIIIVVLVSIIIVRRPRAKEQEQEDGSEQKAVYQDLYGRKFKVYEYESNQIVCHNCLEKLEIQIPIRPLVVTCTRCGKRGVIYK
jgi:flagellar basal body-associated protein FliL